MTLKQIFIRNLKEFRKKEGISQMKLAEYCNTSSGYIGEIEIGRKFPSIEMIEKIASVLGVEPYHFFKKQTDNSDNIDIAKVFTRLPYSIKKQIQKQIKTQVKSQINLSTSQILNEINLIIDKY
jgi:transcriptional regulator with XRE-family HTH domain